MKAIDTSSPWGVNPNGLCMTWVLTPEGLQMRWTLSAAEGLSAIVEIDAVRQPALAAA